MAKATVLACDLCGVWDSVENPVRRVTVAGPKFELCTGCRADLLIALRVPSDVAITYQEMINDKVGKTGALPPLSAAVDLITERRAADPSLTSVANDTASEPLVPAGDPNGDPAQTDILSALADSDADGEHVERGPVSAPASMDSAGTVAFRNERQERELNPVGPSAVAESTSEQDPNETPPKSPRRRK